VEHDGWEVSWIWEPHGAVSGDHVDLMVPASPEEPLHLLRGTWTATASSPLGAVPGSTVPSGAVGTATTRAPA
jgi:hypothetical protein